jgi:hypothetical protein
VKIGNIIIPNAANTTDIIRPVGVIALISQPTVVTSMQAHHRASLYSFTCGFTLDSKTKKIRLAKYTVATSIVRYDIKRLEALFDVSQPTTIANAYPLRIKGTRRRK